MKKKIIGLCAILILATGCGKVPQLENGQEAIVTFNEGAISVDDFYTRIKDSYGLDVLINMIDTYIYEHEFSDYKAEALEYAESSVDAMIEQAGSETDLINSLQQYGYDFQTRQAIVDYLYYTNLYNHAITEYAKLQITDKEIEAYYRDEAIGDMEISHILITPDAATDATDEEKEAAEAEAKATVQEIIDKLNEAKKNGEDITEKFAELAKSYSKDEATKDNGGALGKINYGTLSSSYDELIKAAVNLKDGEYSTSVITTELGYHVILKTKTYEKDTLENLKNSILETLAERYISVASSTAAVGYDTIQYYHKKYKVEIEDDELKSQYSKYIQNLLASVQANSSN